MHRADQSLAVISPAQVALLVLDYLKELGLKATQDAFLKEYSYFKNSTHQLPKNSKTLQKILVEYATMKTQERNRIALMKSFDSAPLVDRTLRGMLQLLDDYNALKVASAEPHIAPAATVVGPAHVSVQPTGTVSPAALTLAPAALARPGMQPTPSPSPAPAPAPAPAVATIAPREVHKNSKKARKSAKPRKLAVAGTLDEPPEPLKQLVTNDDLAMKFAQRILPHIGDTHSNHGTGVSPPPPTSILDHSSNHPHDQPADFDEILKSITADPEFSSLFNNHSLDGQDSNHAFLSAPHKPEKEKPRITFETASISDLRKRHHAEIAPSASATALSSIDVDSFLNTLHYRSPNSDASPPTRGS